MPFTPFHLGPGLLLGLLALRRLDLPTVLVASVFVDVRTTLVFFGLLDGPLHGPFHTLLGASVLSLVLIAVALPLRPRLDPVLRRIRFPQASSRRRIAAGAFVGTWLHVVLDATLYTDMAPFAPLSTVNPLLGQIGSGTVYLGCLVAGVVGVGLYALSVLGVIERLSPVPHEENA